MRPAACTAARTLRVCLLLLAAGFLVPGAVPDARADEASAPVVVAHLRGAVDPVSARYLRRVLVVEQLLGATGTLTRELGRDVLDRRQLPPLVPL